MPLSTSSFDRPVPERPWLILLVVTLALTAASVFAWELRCRGKGYGPSLNDTEDLWALQRDRVAEESIVIIGSSRTLFDLDLDEMAKDLKSKPLHLAIVGSSPQPILADLAADQSFRGTLVVGVTPGLFFAGGGPPMVRPGDALSYREKRSPSQRSGGVLGRFLQDRLAFIQEDDLTLRALLERLDMANREGAAVPPKLPPYMAKLGHDRSMKMTLRLENDPALQNEIQEIWQGILGSMPPMDEETVEAIRRGVLADVSANVEKIHARGGDVVFLRLPSTGWLRDVESKGVPREKYWDALLEATGAPGIHFEDHSELRGFDCPEWSHLTASDATRYTRALMPILMSRLDAGALP